MRYRAAACCLLVALLGLAGCASGPSYSDVKSTIPPLASDRGRIYFYRASGVAGAAIQPDIRLNEDVVGRSQPNSFFYVDRAPGRMEVRLATETEEKVNFDLAAGQTRYVETRVEMGLLVGHIVPKLVTREQGEMDLESGTLAYVPAQDVPSLAASPSFPRATPIAGSASDTAATVARMHGEPAKAGLARVGNLPPPGSRWSYAVHEQSFSDNQWDDFSVVLTSADASGVTEVFFSPFGREPSVFDAQSMSFVIHRMKRAAVMELSPYLLAYTPSPTLPLKQRFTAYPDEPGSEWALRVIEMVPESLSLPVGRFNTVRLRISGEKRGGVALSGANERLANRNTPQRFQYTVWYAPEVSRYVQSRHQVFDTYGQQLSDQWVQLRNFEMGTAAAR